MAIAGHIDSPELEACFVPGRAASPGLRKWPWGTERQVLTVGSLQIKPEGYVQKPVSVASATWTAEIYFSCYDMKVGFHLQGCSKLGPGEREAKGMLRRRNHSEISKHLGMAGAQGRK